MREMTVNFSNLLGNVSLYSLEKMMSRTFIAKIFLHLHQKYIVSLLRKLMSNCIGTFQPYYQFYPIAWNLREDIDLIETVPDSFVVQLNSLQKM